MNYFQYYFFFHSILLRFPVSFLRSLPGWLKIIEYWKIFFVPIFSWWLGGWELAKEGQNAILTMTIHTHIYILLIKCTNVIFAYKKILFACLIDGWLIDWWIDRMEWNEMKWMCVLDWVIDGRIDGWMDGWLFGWMDWCTVGWMNSLENSIYRSTNNNPKQYWIDRRMSNDEWLVWQSIVKYGLVYICQCQTCASWSSISLANSQL